MLGPYRQTQNVNNMKVSRHVAKHVLPHSHRKHQMLLFSQSQLQKSNFHDSFFPLFLRETGRSYEETGYWGSLASKNMITSTLNV